MGEYELYHASRKSHKYIKKIGNRYFYSQAEIQAFYNKDKTEKDVVVKDKIEKDAVVKDKIKKDRVVKEQKRRKKKGASVATKYLNKPVKSLKKQVKKGKKIFDTVFKPKSSVEVIDRIDNKTGEHF
jgi:hypothetical protein